MVKLRVQLMLTEIFACHFFNAFCHTDSKSCDDQMLPLMIMSINPCCFSASIAM